MGYVKIGFLVTLGVAAAVAVLAALRYVGTALHERADRYDYQPIGEGPRVVGGAVLLVVLALLAGFAVYGALGIEA